MPNDRNQNIENVADDVVVDAPCTDAANDEFKLTVRKLEMPVRPRGVLAE